MDNRPPLSSFKQRPPLDSFLNNQDQPNKILKSGLDAAKSTIRSIIPGGEITADAIPGMSSPTLKAGDEAAQGVGDWTSRNMPESPNLKTPLGNINPKTVTSTLVGGALRPTSLAAAGVAPELGTEAKFIPGAMGDVFNTVKNDVGNIPSMISKAPGTMWGGIKKAVSLPGKIEMAVGDEITPKASSAILKNMVGMSPEEAQTIHDTYQGSTSPLVDQIKTGLQNKIKQAGDLYKTTIDNAPNDIQINPSKFRSSIDEALPQLEANLGKEHPLAQTLRTMRDSTSRNPNLAESMQGGVGQDIIKPISKEGFMATRDALNKLSGNDQNINRILQGVKNGLYDSAGESGITGLDKAKAAYRTAKDFEGRFLNNNEDLKFAESKLNRIGTKTGLPIQDMQALKELENYTGTPFMDQASKINKVREFQNNYKGSTLQGALQKMQDPHKTNLRNEYGPLMGDQAKEVFDLLKKNKFHKSLLHGTGYTGTGGLALGGLKMVYDALKKPTQGYSDGNN